MANVIKTSNGSTINVAGLSPQQIAQVQKMANSNKGNAATALASTFQKGTAAATGATMKAPVNLRGQQRAQWYLDQQKQTGTVGTSGATGTTTTTGQPLPEGAPDLLSTDDLTKLSNDVRDANYSFNTRDYGTQKQQEIEAAKQDLANRGIPENPDPNSLWGRTLSQIDKKYETMDLNARNAAASAGTDRISALSAAGANNFTAYMNAQYQLSNVENEKLKLDQDYQLALKKFKSDRDLQALANAGAAAVARIRNSSSNTTETGPQVVGSPAP